MKAIVPEINECVDIAWFVFRSLTPNLIIDIKARYFRIIALGIWDNRLQVAPEYGENNCRKK
jgi:hypothetical protein